MIMSPRIGLYVKRVFDLHASLLMLVVLMPLFLIVSFLIFCIDGLPIFYTQERVGIRGRRFRILKFRTMRPGSDCGNRITVAEDGRITRMGAILRANHLDELPQLINILKGDMSLVGPRPEVPEFVDEKNPKWKEVLSIRPGLTSPETLAFREQGVELGMTDDHIAYYRNVIRPRKLELQLVYVRTRTFAMDIKTLFHTLLDLVRRHSN